MRRMVAAVAATAGLILAMVLGCSSPPKPASSLPSGMVWEYGWVDPMILYSDELLTLVQAARVDSFPVPIKPDSVRAEYSLAFDIPDSASSVSINLYDSQQTLVLPLMVRRLEPGFYRVTVTRAGLVAKGIFPDRYLIVASFSGSLHSAEFSFR